jgi:hypothetical protein
MPAGCPIRTIALAERHLPQAEVVSELLPFDVGRLAVFLARPMGPALNDKQLHSTYISV